MARRPRLIRAGHVYHVIQRGHNRQPVFGDDDDRRRMLILLAEQAAQHGVQIHAYVLMGNHLHLLVTPSTDEGLGLMIQGVGRHYVRAFNLRWKQHGTLWQGRYASHLVASDPYLLAVMRYIDLNPVRAGLVESAQDWPWSSYRALAGLAPDPLVTPHACWWGLGNTPFDREHAYRQWVADGIAADQHKALQAAMRTGHAWVPQALRESLGLPADVRPRGRPRKR